jgi:hypothetical protein
LKEFECGALLGSKSSLLFRRRWRRDGGRVGRRNDRLFGFDDDRRGGFSNVGIVSKLLDEICEYKRARCQ